MGVDSGVKLLNGFASGIVGEPITRGLSMSWLEVGDPSEPLLAPSSVLRRWPRSALGGWSTVVGVEGSDIGCFFGMGGGTRGDAAEDVEDPVEVLVSILRSGGAVSRFSGGVTEPGGLGFWK